MVETILNRDISSTDIYYDMLIESFNNKVFCEYIDVY